MKRVMWLAWFAVLAGCDSVMEPDTEPVIPPSEAVVHLGTSYTLIDEQAKRLYEFNNCLSGLPPYTANANCQASDVTYEAASVLNWELASIFDWGTNTTKSEALAFLDNYITLSDWIYFYGRVSCRGRHAARGFADKLRTIISALDGSQTVDLSSLPQPLNAPLWELDQFNGATYNGASCGPTVPGPAFASAGGHSIFAMTTSCATAPRALEINGDEFYAMKTVHTNGSLRVGGSRGVVWDKLSYRCALSSVGLNNWLGLSGLPELVTSTAATPISFNPASVPCNYTASDALNLNNNGPWWVGGTSASRRLNTGVWCATGSITLTIDAVAGEVMLKAGGQINIQADLVYFRSPHPSGVVMYTSGSGTAMALGGAYQSFAGYLYAPNGQVYSVGDDFTVNGAIVASRVRLDGIRASVVTADQQ